VQVIRVSSADVDEVHLLELRDQNASTPAQVTLKVISTDIGSGPLGLDGSAFAINCGGSASDQVSYEFDSDGSLSDALAVPVNISSAASIQDILDVFTCAESGAVGTVNDFTS